MQNEIILNMQQGIRDFLGMIDWVFTVFYMLVTWLVNDTTDAQNKAPIMNFFQKIGKFWRSLIMAVLSMVFFAWAFKYSLRFDWTSMIISTLVGLAIWKIGIKTVMNWVSTRVLGFKLDKKN